MNRKESGSGLIEVMIVLAMIAFSVGGLTRLQTELVRTSARAHNTIGALYLAESWLEGYRALQPVTSDELSGKKDFDKYTILFSSRKLGEPEGLKQVTVRVVWSEEGGSEQSVRLETAVHCFQCGG